MSEMLNVFWLRTFPFHFRLTAQLYTAQGEPVMEISSEIREEANKMKLLCVSNILDLIEEGQMHRDIQVL